MNPDIQKDFQRQIEILAFCLNGESFSKADLACKYDVAEITINRDLNSLRNMGIHIFSKKGKVRVEDTPNTNLLVDLASNYLNLRLNSAVLNNKVKSLSKLEEIFFLNKLVLLSKAVYEHKIISLTYTRFLDDKTKPYKIKPINLFSNELNWILNAYDFETDSPKTFYLSRIKSVALTAESFTTKIKTTSKNSLHKIKLRFNPEVKNQIYDKIWFTEFEIEDDKNGYVILTTEQEISNKLSSWCISWWNMIEVLEPTELKNEIKEMIEQFQKTNF